MCLEPGSRRDGVGNPSAGKVTPTQQPVVESVVWCVCEICGLRIRPVYVKRSSVGHVKTIYI